jgi:hypothetical protein
VQLCVKNKIYEANGKKAIIYGTQGTINYLRIPIFGVYLKPSHSCRTFTPSVSESIPMKSSDLHFGSGGFSGQKFVCISHFPILLHVPPYSM